MISYFLHERSEILPFVPVNAKFALDVGCAAGSFGFNLKKNFNCKVWGIEPNAEAAKVAEEKLDRVFNCFFTNDINLEDQKFDVIFFNDVLEHLVNPWEALAVASKHLNHDGCIIASIPNILHFETMFKILRERDWKYEDQGVMDKTHLRFFTKKSMIRLFNESGFHVQMIQGINPYFFRFVYYLNKFTFNRFDELKYPQFLIKAIKKDQAPNTTDVK